MIKQSNRMFDLPLQNANAFQTITKSTPDLLKHLIECPKDGLIDRGRTSSSNRLTHMELLRHELELNIIWQNHDVWVDQICQFLWIRSPALEFTLRTARDRYYQFFELLASNLTVSPEPTPDIQLVWLTHQLSLSSFDRFSRSFDGRLVEHDAVPPVLGNQEALASTETAFRARFGEGYRRCLCWDCQNLQWMAEKSFTDIRDTQQLVQDSLQEVAYHRALEYARRSRLTLPFSS